MLESSQYGNFPAKKTTSPHITISYTQILTRWQRFSSISKNLRAFKWNKSPSGWISSVLVNKPTYQHVIQPYITYFFIQCVWWFYFLVYRWIWQDYFNSNACGCDAFSQEPARRVDQLRCAENHRNDYEALPARVESVKGYNRHGLQRAGIVRLQAIEDFAVRH